MIEQAMIERVARAIVRQRIDTGNRDMLEGYGIPFGVAVDPVARDAAEAAAIDGAWPAWRTAARSFIAAMRDPVEDRRSIIGDAANLHQRPWQVRVAGHDRRQGDRRKVG